MMKGLVPITKDEYRVYFERSDDFYCRPADVPADSSFAFAKGTDLLAAYRDHNGECFARTTYWKVS